MESVATVSLVYVAEAHAQDEWPIGSQKYTAPQHKSFLERKQVAESALPEFKLDWPVAYDALPDDHFTSVYGAWPIGFYVFQGDVLEYVAESFESSFLVGRVASKMRALRQALFEYQNGASADTAIVIE
jgi:hypothetical protein